MIGLTLLGIVVAIAAIGPFVAPHPPTEFVTSPYAAASGDAPLGGDELGRDVLSRVLAGGWVLLLMAAGATLLGVLLGVVIGIPAAYFGRAVDGVLMRTVDVVLAFPQLVFALLLVSVVGPKLWLLVLAVALTHAPQVARVVRSAALDVTERDFVRALDLMRVPRWRIIGGEILPNLTSIVVVELGLRMAWSIILIAGLSFIGFGLQPPDPNWGLMINENRAGLVANPAGVVVPVALVAVLTVGLNLYTDAVARVSLGIDRARTVLTDAISVREEAT
jgi:peptide/nickel transport system permease protein